jgi:cytochrome c-type biogenesis protein CcmH/NrfG
MAVMAMLLSAILVVIAAVSLRYQWRTLRRLRSGESIPSDDRAYLRGVCQRRTLNAILLLLLAGMVAGAFLSGGQQELNRIIQLKQQDPEAKHTPEDLEFAKWWLIYWIVVLVVLFFVLVVALADYTATSLYGRQQMERIREEQRVLLERDLALYRQHKLNDRMRRSG